MMKRREFIKAGLASTGGLAVGLALPGCAYEENSLLLNKHTFSFFLEIGENGRVLFKLTKPEIGQGVETGISMVVCDELGAAWDTFDVEIATFQMSPDIATLPARPEFFTTGASNGVRRTWEPLRHMAATARDMLIRAAAARWSVEALACDAEDGRIIHRESGQTFGFGELAAQAATLKPADEPRLKGRADFSIIGQSKPGRRTPLIVRGQEEYGLDVNLPGMVHASIERSPAVGGRLQSVDDSRARQTPGVFDIVQLDGFPDPSSDTRTIDADLSRLMKPGVAVIANHPWAALQGRRALDVRWDDGPNAGMSVGDLRQELTGGFDDQTESYADIGNVEEALNASSNVVSAVYENPFQASFGLEPLNATARRTDDGGIELWAGSQSPQMTSEFIAEILGIPFEKVIFHNMRCGGSFGRRWYCDFAVEAAVLAFKTGRAVKLMWSREDDIQHSKFHSFRLERHRIGLDEDNRPYAWDYSVSLAPHDWIGLHGPYVPYFGGIPNRRARAAYTDTHLAHRGSWRSVMLHPQHLSLECAVDEVASEIGEDPLAMRLRWLTLPPSWPGEEVDAETLDSRRQSQQRSAAVLRAATDAIGWGRPRPSNTGVGVALGRYVDTFAGQVAEVEVSGGNFIVRKLVCALDCGLVVNPNLVRSQIEGSLAWALGPVLYDPIDIRNGRVVQSNFHDYSLPIMADMPDIEVILVDSDGPPAGVGEPAVIAVAPAILNAIYAASGQRLRALPARLE